MAEQTTLNRDAVPIGDNIEPVRESPTENKKPKIMEVLFTGVGVLLVSEVVVLGDIFKLNRWRKKKENEQSRHVSNSDLSRPQIRELRGEQNDPTSYLISFLVDWRILSKDENDTSMKVFQEAMIYSCVEVVVREMERQMQNSQRFCCTQNKCGNHR